MAWTGVITNAGANLLDQWALGGTLTITSAATGTGTVDTAALVNQTNLKSRKQTASIISKVRKSSGVKVKLQITAPSTGYTLNQYGVWAKLGSGAAVLLALFQREDGVPIPSSAETPEFVYTLYALLTISNTGTLEVTVDTSALVSQSTLEEAMATKAEMSHTHDAGDIASGTLAVARGGTGQTTAKNAATSLLTSLGTGDAIMQDETLIATSKYDGTTEAWYKRPASLLWSYIKGKADAVYAAISHTHTIAQVTNLQTALNGKAAESHTHAASDISSGALPITRGGTGNGNALGAITALGGASIASRGIEIQENTNLNSLTTPGTYYSPNATRSATLGNPPLTGAGFKLYVIQDYGSTSLLQVATTIASTSYINQTYLRGGTTLQVARPWSDWYRVSFSGHTHAVEDIISGTLPITRGGTGKTTAAAAASALLSEMDAEGATYDVQDSTLIATSANTGENGKWYRRSAVKFWNYIKAKTDALYAAVGHTHDSRYFMLTSGTRIVSSADDPADLNDAEYQVAGNYYCNSSSGAKTVRHTPNFDSTTLVNPNMVQFTLKVSYSAGTSDVVSQELRVFTSGHLYYRFHGNNGWTAWTLVRGTASALIQHLVVSTTNAQDTMYFATTAVAGETGTWYKRPASAVWNYIKDKAARELYITAGANVGTTMGEFATAEGSQTTASSPCSHAEGAGTTASGQAAHAEGANTVASGWLSHAEGSATSSSGICSHAEGASTQASGVGSHAEGNNTIASMDYQHVFGQYNKSDTTNVEIVGWGTGTATSARKNIRTLATNGNMTIAGTLTQSSDARLKDVQGEVPDLSGIRAVRFRWNDTNGEHDEKDHIGYIAQDVEQIAPFLVGDDSNGYKSLDYIALLCAKVEWLERRVAELEGKEAGA